MNFSCHFFSTNWKLFWTKKINLLFKTIFVLTVFTLISCEEEEFTLGAITAPTDVTLTAEIVGATADEPNGDGSGTVHFTVTGNGAITYKFSFVVYEFNTIVIFISVFWTVFFKKK